MNQILSLVTMAMIAWAGIQNNPENLLKEAQTKLLESEGYSYNQKITFFPNPMGESDIYHDETVWQKNEKSLVGFDYIISDEDSDIVNVNGEFKLVLHDQEVVRFYPAQMKNEEEENIKTQLNVRFSPLAFFEEGGWEYVKDTTVNGRELSNFYKVDSDYLYEGNKVYTEHHIFIDKESKDMELFDRRNYYNDKMSQRITFDYSSFEYSDRKKLLSYELPKNYKSSPYGQPDERVLLSEGEVAPIFFGKDMDGNSVDLASLKGKKVLLGFSVMSCGYCKLSLDLFNKPDYKLDENITAIYINPVDSNEDMKKYRARTNIPFSVLTEANGLADQYGVSSYPSFFLIDEEGKIEKVVAGYDKEFLQSLKAEE